MNDIMKLIMKLRSGPTHQAHVVVWIPFKDMVYHKITKREVLRLKEVYADTMRKYR
jgi:hypothetical protein